MLILLAVLIQEQNHLLYVASYSLLLLFIITDILHENAWQAAPVGSVDIGKHLVADNDGLFFLCFKHQNGLLEGIGSRFVGIIYI